MISTYREGLYYIMEVADDGAGFDVNQKYPSDKSHIGVDSVRHRIEKMCA